VRGRFAIGAVFALMAMGVVVAIWQRQAGNHGTATASAAQRTVLVTAGGAPLPAKPFYTVRDCLRHPTTCVNGTDGIVLAYAVSGSISGHSGVATVLTDENCEPDRDGVSHCMNRLELDDGMVLTVRHDHAMSNDPCLAPGERVAVRLLA
jgi:hypothetical protein